MLNHRNQTLVIENILKIDFIESFVFVAQHDFVSLKDDLVQKITLELATYISLEANTDLSQITALKDFIADELRNKLDQSQMNLNNDDLDTIRGAAKVLLKNLPVTIHAIISNIKKVNKFK